jgi:hypothetical protein
LHSKYCRTFAVQYYEYYYTLRTVGAALRKLRKRCRKLFEQTRPCQPHKLVLQTTRPFLTCPKKLNYLKIIKGIESLGFNVLQGQQVEKKILIWLVKIALVIYYFGYFYFAFAFGNVYACGQYFAPKQSTIYIVFAGICN